MRKNPSRRMFYACLCIAVIFTMMGGYGAFLMPSKPADNLPNVGPDLGAAIGELVTRALSYVCLFTSIAFWALALAYFLDRKDKTSQIDFGDQNAPAAAAHPTTQPIDDLRDKT